jgi:phage gpG-like protein
MARAATPRNALRRQRNDRGQATHLEQAADHRAAVIDGEGDIAVVVTRRVADHLRQAERVETHVASRPDWLQSGVHECAFLSIS